MQAMTHTALPLLVIALFGVLFWLQQRRHRARLRQQRAEMWRECLGVLQDAQVLQDDINFPRLEGRYRDLQVSLEPIADHVAYRKLPQLWLRATMRATLPVAGSIDLLVRPENIEFYSSLWSLPVEVPLPAHWPSHALIRADCEEVVSMIPLLDDHIGMFDDPRMKELVVSPRGVRLVCQLAQGSRADYSVFRRVNFGEALQVPSQRLRELLDRQLSLIHALRRHPATPAAVAAGSRAV